MGEVSVNEGKERIGCPNCGAQYAVPVEWQGRRVACRRCGERFVLVADALAESGPSASETTLSFDDAGDSLGRLAVRFKMLSSDQLRRALDLQSRQAPEERERLGDILVSSGMLSPRQLNFLTSIQQLKEKRMADRRFGDLAIAQGIASAEEVEAVMDEQKRRFLDQGEKTLIGDLLVRQGVITAEQRKALLEAQQRDTSASRPLFSIRVSDDRLSADAVLNSGEPPGQERVAAELERQGIVFGIDGEALAALCQGDLSPGEWITIARGKAPEPPMDAHIDYLFETHPLNAGRQEANGVIDFRDRGEIPQVAPGEVVARKNPSHPGEPGTDVFGHILNPPEPRDALLSADSGTELSDDGSTVTATEEGRPSVSAVGAVSVYPEYRVEGDIGLDTGHVNFHGRVVVPGAVESGFRVRCGELVAGEVREADIEATGNVSVAGGVIGGHIHAGGTVRVLYLQKASLEVSGDVIVDKEAVESTVECGGAFLSPRCTVLGSEVTARKGIFVAAVGSETAAATRLVVGVEEPGAKELARLNAAIAERKDAMAGLEGEKERLHERLEELEQLVGDEAQFQDRAMVRQRELRQSVEAMENADLSEKAESFRQELEDLEPRVAAAERHLAEFFDEQERITERLNRFPEQMQQSEDEVGELQGKRDHFRQWFEQEPGVAVVQVDGTLDQHTVVKTPHLDEVHLKTDHRHVRLEERMSRDEQGRLRWRVGTAAWKKPNG